ncbi:MAG: cytochrome c nitrite reductase small subunit [Gemmatimonas sp.]|nr:cytochrome c nitrite reductase small subunit [Gemmatimonas sp.]
MALLLAILLGGLIGLGGSTFIYGEGFAYLSNDPQACKNCHIMNDQYDSWLKSSHHAVATCNDCHTPHALLPKYLTKAENGFWHSKGFTLQDFPEPIRIRPHNRRTLNRNCLECHHELVHEVVAVHGRDESQFDCIRCHITSGHGPAR